MRANEVIDCTKNPKIAGKKQYIGRIKALAIAAALIIPAQVPLGVGTVAISSIISSSEAMAGQKAQQLRKAAAKPCNPRAAKKTPRDCSKIVPTPCNPKAKAPPRKKCVTTVPPKPVKPTKPGKPGYTKPR